ncbi:MAG: tellurium resistance protein TerC [Bacteroidota bacterium]|nr:tellurium resistance protein TerC [Bacteroidota bacterium]
MIADKSGNKENYAIRVRKIIYRLSLLFGISELGLILASWLLTAAMPDVQLRSLLSSGGIRWFFSNFATLLSSPVLVNILLLAIAWGSITTGGLWSTITLLFSKDGNKLPSQQNFALKASLLLLISEIVFIISLSFFPHAILLGISGELFPSSFSKSLIPIIAFMATSVGAFFSILSGKSRSLFDIGQCLTSAGSWIMPVLLLYIFTAQFFFSLYYVFVN